MLLSLLLVLVMLSCVLLTLFILYGLLIAAFELANVLEIGNFPHWKVYSSSSPACTGVPKSESEKAEDYPANFSKTKGARRNSSGSGAIGWRGKTRN